MLIPLNLEFMKMFKNFSMTLLKKILKMLQRFKNKLTGKFGFKNLEWDLWTMLKKSISLLNKKLKLLVQLKNGYYLEMKNPKTGKN